jgi:hypothetical protein
MYPSCTLIISIKHIFCPSITLTCLSRVSFLPILLYKTSWQSIILSRVLRASPVSSFSLRVHRTRALRSEWSAGAPWSDLCALMCEQAPRLALGPQIWLGPYEFYRMTCLPTDTTKIEHLCVLT